MASLAVLGSVRKTFEDLCLSPMPHARKAGKGKPISLGPVLKRLTVYPVVQFYSYKVTFIPEVNVRNDRFMAIDQLTSVIGKERSFDGTNLCLTAKLQDDRTELQAQLPPRLPQIHVQLVYDGKRAAGHPATSLIYNEVLRAMMADAGLFSDRGVMYAPGMATQLPDLRLDIWPGYTLKVIAPQLRSETLLLQIVPSFKVVRKDTMLDVLEEAYLRHQHEGCMAALKAARKVAANTTVYTAYNDSHYFVTDVDYQLTPTDTFIDRYDRTCRFDDYYRDKYQLLVSKPAQPMLHVRNMHKKSNDNVQTVLVPEFCSPVELSQEAKYDYRYMGQLNDALLPNKDKRDELVADLFQNVINTENAQVLLKAWGLRVTGDY